MILHCPCCHARYSIEALTQDEAARELLALRLAPATLAYLSLFRTEARALSFDRALKLAKEVQQLPATPAQLEQALAETVEALRGRGGKPLKNHNYLKRVLENTPAEATSTTTPAHRTAAHTSRRQQAIASLTHWAGLDWLRIAIAEGLAALVALSLDNTPAADTIANTADIWLHVLSATRLDIEEIDRPRIAAAFSALLGKTTGKWPEPRQLKDHLPPRPQRAAVTHTPEVDLAKGRENMQQLRQQLGG